MRSSTTAGTGGTTAELLGSGPERRLSLSILASIPGLAHAFTVKGSNLEAVLQALAWTGRPSLRTVKQVHGAKVVRVLSVEPPAGQPEGDALVTVDPKVALAVYVADCVPVLVCDPKSRALAAVHAGWRGTVAGVLSAALGVLTESCGARPADLRVAIGPSIGPCCFRVGDEVVEALIGADPGAVSCVQGAQGARRIDLVEANRRQVIEAGVPAGQIQSTGLCTRCREDLLESYRRSSGRAGRMAALVGWTS
jgi:purine-nucleoside/S-methyl-5'-thioadenosine phosphorylase / adenosine deaminase